MQPTSEHAVHGTGMQPASECAGECAGEVEVWGLGTTADAALATFKHGGPLSEPVVVDADTLIAGAAAVALEGEDSGHIRRIEAFVGNSMTVWMKLEPSALRGLSQSEFFEMFVYSHPYRCRGRKVALLNFTAEGSRRKHYVAVVWNIHVPLYEYDAALAARLQRDAAAARHLIHAYIKLTGLDQQEALVEAEAAQLPWKLLLAPVAHVAAYVREWWRGRRTEAPSPDVEHGQCDV